METKRLDYHLPPERIATRPVEPRDHARMMVVWRGSERVEHRMVRDLPAYLSVGDILVFNDTSVVPARLVGRRLDTGGHVEGLFLERRTDASWLVMLRSNGRLRTGNRIELLDMVDADSGVVLTLTEKDGPRWKADVTDRRCCVEALHRVGRTPLPPYILRARREQQAEFADSLDRQWYQTVYASASQAGSVAAPTAGLHFTQQLLEAIESRGVEQLDVTLHVGPGTFAPVTTKTLDEHVMHSERYEVCVATLRRLAAREHTSVELGRLLAVGTTAVRTLESLPESLPRDPTMPLRGETDLLIGPPYRFKRVQGMLTNFHLPKSTLLALVAAMIGLDRLQELYSLAVREEYRFYSYGDAMLILP